MIGALLALLLAGAARAEQYPLPAPPAVSTSTTLLRFSADHMDYEASTSSFHLKGHVLILESTRTIKGDEIWVDTTRRSGRSEGLLYVEDGAGAVASEKGGDFDFESGSGHLYKTSAGHGFWRVHAREAEITGHKKLDYLSANFTSCDVVPPHYHLHARRLTVVSGSHFAARNVVFYLGPVPLFYVPYMYKSLGREPKLHMKFQPGYDRRNGAYLKGTMFTQFTPYLYNKLYLDLYSRQGVGLGTELERHKGDDRGVITAYQIHETTTKTERWALASNAYQTVFSTSIAVQVRAQIQSDADFNNHYARSSTFRVTPELDNNVALIYRKPKYNVRLSYARLDLAAPDRIHYIRQSEDAPRLDFQTTQLKLGKLPWLNTFTGFADNNFSIGRSYIQKSAGGAWEATQTIPLARGVAFIPKVNYQETFYDRIDQATDFMSSTTYQDAAIGRYLAEGDLRWGSPVGALDLTYDFQRRLKADTMAEDVGAPDRGIEQNRLSLLDAVRPSRALLLRASSAYDFRAVRTAPVGFRDRVQPIVGEAIYTPRGDWSFTLRNDYQLQQGERSFVGTLTHGDEDRSFYSFVAGYNAAAPNAYGLDALFGLSNDSGTWKLGGALRSQFGTTGGVSGAAADRFQLFEKELSLTKVWHDFFTRAMVRFRPGGVREFTARVELRFGPGDEKTRTPVGRRDWESEWFPERSNGAHDRP